MGSGTGPAPPRPGLPYYLRRQSQAQCSTLANRDTNFRT